MRARSGSHKIKHETKAHDGNQEGLEEIFRVKAEVEPLDEAGIQFGITQAYQDDIEPYRKGVKAERSGEGGAGGGGGAGGLPGRLVCAIIHKAEVRPFNVAYTSSSMV